MRLKTLGGLSVEGSAFTRPVPLLLLAYVRLRGNESRQHLGNVFFIDKADSGDSVSVALRQLEHGLGDEVIDRDWDSVASRIDCDLLELNEAYAKGDLEAVVSVYGGPFLENLEASRYVKSEDWSEELASWVHKERLKVASKVFAAGVRLGTARLSVGRRDEASRYADIALRAFFERFEYDEYTAEHSSFNSRDLRTAHGLLTMLESDWLPEFLRCAAAYEHLELPTSLDAVAAQFDKPDGAMRAPLERLVGRVRERAQIDEALAAGPKGFVTLHGAGGYGKTTLARHVAFERSQSGRYPDGVFFVGLEDIRFANLIPVRLAEAFGLELSPASDALDQVISRLRHAKALIVLDNFDHVIDRADVPDRLVTSCAGVDVIVTSRERLGTEHEHVLPLGGLTVPEEGDVAVEEITASDAVELFLARSARDATGPEPDSEVLRVIASICRSADGSPLVIDLAASLTNVIPVADIEALLARDSAVIESPRTDLPERHRSVRAVWQYSWDLLEPADRAALARLAAFPDSFDWVAAHSVADVTAQQLQGFVDRSQLRVSDQQRFSFHPLLAAFVREAAASADLETTADRHRDYYLGRARELSKLSSTTGARAAMATFDVEAGNLRAAWESTSDPATLLEFVSVLEPFQVRRGRWDERLRLLARAREVLNESGRTDDLAALLNATADVHLQQGEVELADRALSMSLAMQDGGQRTALMAETLSQRGGVHFMRRELDEAADSFERARAILAELGDTQNELSEVGNLAAVQYLRGEFEEAIRLWKYALARQRRARNLDQQAQVLNNLGAAFQTTGRLEEALVHFEKAHSLFDDVDDSINRLVAKGNIGNVLFQRGEFAGSRKLYLEILSEHRRTGNVEAGALILNNLAMIDEREGDLPAARARLREALADQEAIDDRLNRTATLHNLSTVELQLGRPKRALALAMQAAELAAETFNDIGRAYALLFLGDALTEMKLLDRAEEALNEAAELFAAGHEVAGIVQAMTSRSLHALALGDMDEALRLSDAAISEAAHHDMLPLAERAERARSRVADDAMT